MVLMVALEITPTTIRFASTSVGNTLGLGLNSSLDLSTSGEHDGEELEDPVLQEQSPSLAWTEKHATLKTACFPASPE